MLFSTNFWLFSLVWAAVGAGLAFVLAKWGGPIVISPSWEQPPRTRDFSMGVAIATFIIALLSVRAVMYYEMPAFQGAFWGYGSVLVAALFPGLLLGMLAAGKRRKVIFVDVGMLLCMLAYPPLFKVWEGVGPYNGHRLADLPQIKTAPEDAKIPPSDPSQLVMVTSSIAHFKGQAVIGQLGSKYELKPEAWTLQSVQKHRYWVAPLTLHNFGDTWNIDDPESPGYVVVDAENPEVDAVLKDGFHIKLFSDQSWGLFLQRHLYVNGFKDGIIDSPYFEVDDNWQPHWICAYIKRPFGGTAGSVVEKVIVVNVANRDPKIETYNPNDPEDRKRFAWVDRVVTRGLVTEYATDWGKWSGEFAHSNPWSVWWGYNKTGTKMPADVELCYTVGGENVWVVPMTSTNPKEHTCLGVLVFETNRNEGTFYPGLKGFNVATSALETMKQARDNIKHYPVGHIQLMSIFGELTWVAIYEAPQSTGSSFGGIGLLHAHGQNAGDVVFATDKHMALSRYQVQLAGRHYGNNENVSRTAVTSKEVKGRILRIAPLPSQGSLDGQGAMYQFRVVGDNQHVFLVQRSVYAQIALVREGDGVTLTYIEPDEKTTEAIGGIKEVPIKSLHCPALDQ